MSLYVALFFTKHVAFIIVKWLQSQIRATEEICCQWPRAELL